MKMNTVTGYPNTLVRRLGCHISSEKAARTCEMHSFSPHTALAALISLHVMTCTRFYGKGEKLYTWSMEQERPFIPLLYRCR